MIIHDMEQRTPEWYALRLGMPTGSMFSKLITSEGKPSKSLSVYARTLAGELFSGKELEAWEGNQWTERGKEMEDSAKRLYEFANDVSVVDVGFITDDNKTWGCSPDGLVGDDGMVEYKCLKGETHIETIMYYKKHGKCPTKYVQQTQGQILIAERKWCDLVFYHPELPNLTIRQEPLASVVEGLLLQKDNVILKRDEIIGVLNDTS
jgi:hypothetical protein